MPKPAIQIANNVYRVPTMGSAINSFVVIEEDSSVTIIDAGLKHAYKKIISALDYLGSDHSDVRRILFTHSHSDHTDGAPKLIQKLGTPKVYAHEEELKYMETGENPPRDLSHLAGLFFRFMPFGKHEPVKVDEAIHDRQILPIGGGLEVIHTPGHTPGHSSFLFKESGVLITGDSLVNYGFARYWSLSAFCTSFEQSKKTALKFLDLDFDIAAFTHGPHIQSGGKKALKNFLTKKVRF